MDIELLLHWAFRDELSKRQVSAAEGIWDRIQENQHHGGVDSGHGGAQRYAHFGLPDPDAETIEKTMAGLKDKAIDWNVSFDCIASDLAGLVSVNDVMPRAVRATYDQKVGWGQAGAKALRAWFGPGSDRPAHDRPRDVLMVGTIKVDALVTMHAIKGTRPDWWDEEPRPQMVLPKSGGSNASIIGECRGKNLYSSGSCCPLRWAPSPASIVMARAEYAAWHGGLQWLAQNLELRKFAPLMPKAPAAPWLIDDERESTVLPVMPADGNGVDAWGTLPLSPARDRKLSPKRYPKAGPVSFPLVVCE